MRLAVSQAQDVADAASQAAMLGLRRTGSTAQATTMAQQVVSLNKVAGKTATMNAINFGIWDDEIDIGHYKVSDSFPMPYDLELKSNLALYRKALDKVKKLKAFL